MAKPRTGENKGLTRHQKRELAFCLLYEADMRSREPTEVIYETALREREIPDDEYVRRVFFGTREKVAFLDEIIQQCSNIWKVQRMSYVIRNILRLAAFEMSEKIAPPKVVINEAMLLAEQYGEDNSMPLCNGILNHLGTNLGLLHVSEESPAEQSHE
ncbi:MAG: transcription antitermination factor NusB [Clostridia bacterium]|nr:transcription antitermination factor NusB [Clostridia bacterium]